jgi:hypothetical protein
LIELGDEKIFNRQESLQAGFGELFGLEQFAPVA